MPVPAWVAKINKRVFNPIELKRGARPVLTHVGRSSGTTHRTPLDAHRIDGGFIFIAVYGAESDWVRNILASGTATVAVDGDEYPLTAPRLISRDAASLLLPETSKLPAGFMNVTDYLQMDIDSDE